MLSDLSVHLHRLSLLNEAVKHGGNLRAGRGTLWIKQIFGFSLYQSVADCPLHYCFCVIRDLVRVFELVKISRNSQLVALVVRVAVEDGGKLFAGNSVRGCPPCAREWLPSCRVSPSRAD